MDSNAYIEFSKFYYTGKCSSAEITDYVKKLLLYTQSIGGAFIYEFAANETSFDYGTNGMNVDVVRQMVFAVDTLITQFSSNEILLHKGTVGKPLYIHRDNTCNYKSVFESNFPQIFVGDKNVTELYYLSYLYRLKIQEIYQQKSLSPLEQIKQIFFYMNNTIGVMGDIEFQLAKMLFLGDQSYETAKSILKVDKSINLKLINNTVTDIVLFRFCKMMASLLTLPVFFVSGDDGLTRIFELNETLVSSSNMLSCSQDLSDVKPTLQSEWDEFFYEEIAPQTQKNFMLAVIGTKTYEGKAETIKKEIISLEAKLY